MLEAISVSFEVAGRGLLVGVAGLMDAVEVDVDIETHAPTRISSKNVDSTTANFLILILSVEGLFPCIDVHLTVSF